MLGLNKTMDQLAMANSVRLQGHIMKRKHGRILKRA